MEPDHATTAGELPALRCDSGDAQRQRAYALLCRQLDALLEGEHDVVANLANASALINEALDDVNWVGFYVRRTEAGDPVLVLGPFQGRIACTRIPVGRGVCGAAAAGMEAVVVDDVHAFPGHIACDAASRSELVVPVIVDGTLFGVLDIDSPSLARFDTTDRDGMEAVVAVLARHLSPT